MPIPSLGYSVALSGVWATDRSRAIFGMRRVDLRTTFMKISLRFLPILACVSVSSLFSQVVLNPSPSRVVGQVGFTQTSANLIEGRELNGPQGIALDQTVTPPILYIADTGNNRVLGFRDASSFTTGQRADIVIGQIDFQSAFAQGPNRNGARTTGVAAPVGLAVDASGNLYVVDAGNSSR